MNSCTRRRLPFFCLLPNIDKPQSCVQSKHRQLCLLKPTLDVLHAPVKAPTQQLDEAIMYNYYFSFPTSTFSKSPTHRSSQLSQQNTAQHSVVNEMSPMIYSYCGVQRNVRSQICCLPGSLVASQPYSRRSFNQISSAGTFPQTCKTIERAKNKPGEEGVSEGGERYRGYSSLCCRSPRWCGD